MHEQSLIKDLVGKIALLAAREEGPVVSAKLRLGALAHISPDHLREHFEHELTGTDLEGLQLEIEQLTDLEHPEAQEIVLESLEFVQRNGH